MSSNMVLAKRVEEFTELQTKRPPEIEAGTEESVAQWESNARSYVSSLAVFRKAIADDATLASSLFGPTRKLLQAVDKERCDTLFMLVQVKSRFIRDNAVEAEREARLVVASLRQRNILHHLCAGIEAKLIAIEKGLEMLNQREKSYEGNENINDRQRARAIDELLAYEDSLFAESKQQREMLDEARKALAKLPAGD